MTRRLTALLAAALLGLSALAAGCASDDAVEKDAKNAAREADKAAGNNDEKVAKESKDAGEDAVDAVDDDDGK